MTTEKQPLRPLNSLNLTIVSLERFVYAMRTISEADLWDEAQEHLKARGCNTIAVSVEPILALQGMLRKRRSQPSEAPSLSGAAAGAAAGASAARSPVDDRVDRFIASACAPPPQYPPRPPDDWPPGPWDPPMLEE